MGTQDDPPAPRDSAPPDDHALAGLVRLTILALVGGALAGVVGGLFRLALGGAEVLRTDVLEWTREAPALRWAVPVVLAGVAVTQARLIVRWVPDAAGSGVHNLRIPPGLRIDYP